MGSPVERAKSESAIAVLATAILCIGAVIATLSPVHHYVVSWLTAVPPLTWAAVACGWAAFSFLFARRSYGWAAWVGGLTTLTVGLIPYLQSYASFGRTDPLTYYAMAKYVATTGHSWQDDLYPALQDYIAQLSFHTRLPLRDVVPIWSVVQYAAWIAAVWLGATAWDLTPRQRGLATAASTIPILTQFHFSYYPNGYGILLFVFLCVLWLGRNSIETTILFVIDLLVLPYAHPTVAILAVVLFVILFLATRLVRRLDRRNLTDVFVEAPVLPILSLVLLMSWLINFRQIQLSIRRSFGIAEIRAQSQGLSIVSQLLGAHPSFFNAFTAVILLLGASGILAALVAFGFWAHRMALPKKAAPLLIAAAFFFFASALLLISPNLGQHVVFLRVVTLPYPVLFAPWLLALFLPGIVSMRVTAPLIALSMALALVAIYPSPLEYQPNDQVTTKDFSAIQWVSDHGPNRTTTTLASQLYRFVDGGLGIDARENRTTQFAHGGIPFEIAPPHFGSPESLSNSLQKGRFVVILEFDQRAYTGPWSGTEKWTVDDFGQVASTRGNSRVYDSGVTSILLT